MKVACLSTSKVLLGIFVYQDPYKRRRLRDLSTGSSSDRTASGLNGYMPKPLKPAWIFVFVNKARNAVWKLAMKSSFLI